MELGLKHQLEPRMTLIKGGKLESQLPILDREAPKLKVIKSPKKRAFGTGLHHRICNDPNCE